MKDLIKAALLQKGSNNLSIEDVQITKEALEKAHVYARKIKEVHGSDLECYFFLISQIEKKDRIVRDVYLPNQEVTHAAVRINDEVIIQTGKILREKGFKILGWAHSHAQFHTFHSHTDDENHVSVLNEISSDNYVENTNEKVMFRSDAETLVEDSRVIISDKKKEVTLTLDISGKFNGIVNSSRITAPIKTGFAYSLVVNADEKLRPHCEVAIKEFCPLYLREKDVETYKVPIKVIDDPYKAPINIANIKTEIKEKVKEMNSWGFYRHRPTYYEKGENYPFEDDEKEVYSREDVDRLLAKQKQELDIQSRKKVVQVLREVITAGPLGGMWKVLKRMLGHYEAEDRKAQIKEVLKEIPKEQKTVKPRDKKLIKK